MANPARAYLATQVETTTQGELLIMLYEAAIKFLKQAKMEIDNKDYAKKGIYISKAMAIIHELAESLNKEKGGDITPRLASLYQFCTSQLIKANIRMDTRMIEEVIRILDGLRSAYAQIVPAVDGRVAAPAEPAQPASADPTKPGAPRQPAPPVPPAMPRPQVQAAPKPAAAPQPGQPAASTKMRTAANAAKFRAANAYTNANR
ncbi:MAG: flagellar export chaperone FliS [Desulfovibrionaceae bacterium]|nr:flagellar export chaperone FliS [Desulfovibrionaceae bacterium]